jgi:hypothetical protein
MTSANSTELRQFARLVKSLRVAHRGGIERYRTSHIGQILSLERQVDAEVARILSKWVPRWKESDDQPEGDDD